MKKEKKLQRKKANKILTWALGMLLLIALLSSFREKFAPPDLSQIKYLELRENNQTRILELSYPLSAEKVNPGCPEKILKNLDLILIEQSCQVIPEGASNWTRLLGGEKMLLNQATSWELQLVKGIGIKQAEKILKLRAQLGGFTSWEQLEKSGKLSPQKMQELKRYFMIKKDG